MSDHNTPKKIFGSIKRVCSRWIHALRTSFRHDGKEALYGSIQEITGTMKKNIKFGKLDSEG